MTQKKFIYQKVVEFCLWYNSWPQYPLHVMSECIGEKTESVRREIKRKFGRSWNQLRKEAGWIPKYKRKENGSNRITLDTESTRSIFKVSGGLGCMWEVEERKEK